MSESEKRPEPKFKNGQIVVMKNNKHHLPFRVLEVIWQDGWFYRWNRNNAAAEHMLRAQTAEEIGDR